MKNRTERLKKLEVKTEKMAKKGIIYCEAWYVDQELAADAVKEYLAKGKPIEEFVPEMYEIGYDMTVFEESDED